MPQSPVMFVNETDKMQLFMCYLRKDIIWDSRTTNNQKETKQTLLCQHLF
jgi:hypothetical protein